MRVLGMNLLCTSALLMALVAAPASGTPADTEELRSIIQEYLDLQKLNAGAQGGALLLKGELRVTEVGGVQKVTIPPLEFRLRGGGHFTVEATTLDATALPPVSPAGGSRWNIIATLPTKLRVYGEDGQPELDVSLARQSFQAVWEREFEQFTNVHFELGGLAFKSRKGTGAGRIESVRWDYDLTPGSGGLWSGPGHGSLTGFSLTDPKDKTHFTIARLDFGTECRDCKGAAMKSALRQAREARSPAGQAKLAANPSQMADMIRVALGQCGQMSARYEMTDLDCSIGPTKRAPRPIHLSMHLAGFGGELTPEPGDSLYSGSIRYNVAGLAGISEMDTSGSPLVAGLMPHDLKFELAFRHADPRRFFLGMAQASSSDSADDATPDAAAPDGSDDNEAGAARQARGTSAPGRLREALLPPGAGYDLKELSVDVASGRMLMTGSVTGVEHVPFGLLLDLNLTWTGLDEFLNQLRARAANPGAHPGDETSLASAIQALSVMQLLGQQGDGSDGRSERRYHLVIDEQGQLLLNGTDMRALMNAAGSHEPDGE